MSVTKIAKRQLPDISISDLSDVGGSSPSTGHVLTYNGTEWQPAASSGSSNTFQVEVDFGALPLADATFTINNTSVTPSTLVSASVAYSAPTGKDLDEITMDEIVIVAGNCSTGTFEMNVRSSDGSYLHGAFKVNYKLS